MPHLTQNRVARVVLMAAVTTFVLWRATPRGEDLVRGDDLVPLGAQLYKDKGCVACHSIDGSLRIGPSLKGDFGTTVALADGSRTVVDAAYIRESIVSPQARTRQGYPAVMPSFDRELDARELDALVAYLQSTN